jgi:hypothetical protein
MKNTSNSIQAGKNEALRILLVLIESGFLFCLTSISEIISLASAQYLISSLKLSEVGYAIGNLFGVVVVSLSRSLLLYCIPFSQFDL